MCMWTYVFIHGTFLSTVTCQDWLMYLNARHWWERMHVCLKAFGQTWYISVSHHVSVWHFWAHAYTQIPCMTFANMVTYWCGMNVHTHEISKYENMCLHMGHCWMLTVTCFHVQECLYMWCFSALAYVGIYTLGNMCDLSWHSHMSALQAFSHTCHCQAESSNKWNWWVLSHMWLNTYVHTHRVSENCHILIWCHPILAWACVLIHGMFPIVNSFHYGNVYSYLYIEAYLLFHSLLIHLCKCTLIGLPIRELKIHAHEDAHISVPMSELKDTCICEPSYTSALTRLFWNGFWTCT